MQLDQRLAIDLALEVDHGLERHPVIVPAPGIELRMAARAQPHVAVATRHAQEIPDLLLAAVGGAVAFARAPQPFFRHLVAQPFAGPAEDAHMRPLQADLLLELAEHRLEGRLAVLDAALRKLPCVLMDTLAPEHLVPAVGEDDADVRTVAFLVEHGLLHRYLVKCAFRFFHRPPAKTMPVPAHENLEVFYCDTERSARRGGDRQPSADAARRPHPAAVGGHLYVAAARPAHRAQGGADRARGDESRRRPRAHHARGAARWAVAGVGPLAGVRAGALALQGSARARFRHAAHVGGGHYRSCAERAEELPAAADALLPNPDQVPR